MNSFFGKVSIEDNMALRRAIRDSGYKFIRLNLINPTIKRIQAIRLVVPDRVKGDNNLTEYRFRESSGPLQFAPNETNDMMVADVFDCPENRKFLASHTAYNFWEIEDEDIRKEIQKMADDITARTIRVKKETVPKEEIISDEQLEHEIARLTAEKSKRTMEKTKPERVAPKKAKNTDKKPKGMVNVEEPKGNEPPEE